MIFIGLGSNLHGSFSSSRHVLKSAIGEIAKFGIKILYQSPVYVTAPVPVSEHPWYHNAVIGISTSKSPHDLLKTLQSIEDKFGRVRTVPNAPRIIDLDILAYHDVLLNENNLIVPHPRLHERAFVLYPLRDIARGWVHPAIQKTVGQLIENLSGDQDIQKENYPLVMGIVNVTPDSFSDGGRYNSTESAIRQGLQLIENGADIIDIGGESTRPNSQPVSQDTEQKRVIPVIEGLKNAGALISVDTRNASTMRAALEAGAGMINDITSLTHDAQSVDALRQSDCRICLMHMQGQPQTMQTNPLYKDVVSDVYNYLADRIIFCEAHGISKDRLMIDVGIGFGKSLEHNISLLRNLSRFHDLGVDILLGASRKSFIEKICKKPVFPQDRLSGSLAAAAVAYQQKIHVIRVHDVDETIQFMDVYQEITPHD